MDDNLDAKFGAHPSPPLPFKKNRDENGRHFFLLCGQFCICAMILVALRPPFVVKEVEEGSRLDAEKVGMFAFATTLSSLVFFLSGVAPFSSFATSCEFLYRMSKG